MIYGLLAEHYFRGEVIASETQNIFVDTLIGAALGDSNCLFYSTIFLEYDFYNSKFIKSELLRRVPFFK